MRKQIYRIFVLLILNAIVSCKNNKLEGTYYYQKEKSTDFWTMGKELGCSIIGKFEFKNGNCYFNIMGAEQRVEYDIENNMIFLGSNNLTKNGVGIKIIDENTIEYMGCIFSKKPLISNEINDEHTEDLKDKANLILDLEHKINQTAFIKNFYTKNENIYFELDFIDIKNKETDIEIINKNTKIRIFKLSKKAEIKDCLENNKIDNTNILDYKTEILGNKKFISIFDLENGEITSMNLGCYN